MIPIKRLEKKYFLLFATEDKEQNNGQQDPGEDVGGSGKNNFFPWHDLDSGRIVRHQ